MLQKPVLKAPCLPRFPHIFLLPQLHSVRAEDKPNRNRWSMMNSCIAGVGRAMMRTPMRAMAPVRRGMSSHATVEEATAEMGKWMKISFGGIAACGIYGFFTLTTLEHPHSKEGTPPEYMKIRAKPFPWKSCADCELFNVECWKACKGSS